MSKLATLIVEVLEVGGPRKHTILLALAKHHGASASRFRATIGGLLRGRKIERLHRYGVIHYGLRTL